MAAAAKRAEYNVEAESCRPQPEGRHLREDVDTTPPRYAHGKPWGARRGKPGSEHNAVSLPGRVSQRNQQKARHSAILLGKN